MTFACLVLIMTKTVQKEKLTEICLENLHASLRRGLVRHCTLGWIILLCNLIASHIKPPTRTILMSNDSPLLPTYSVGKGRQSGNERRVERRGIRTKRIDTLFLGSRVATTRIYIV